MVYSTTMVQFKSLLTTTNIPTLQTIINAFTNTLNIGGIETLEERRNYQVLVYLRGKVLPRIQKWDLYTKEERVSATEQIMEILTYIGVIDKLW